MNQFFAAFIFFTSIQIQELAAQNHYSIKRTSINAKNDFRNRIGAELPDQSYHYLYKKTADGRDSVDIYRYTLYNYPERMDYKYEGRYPIYAFVGTLKDGAMLTGRLNYENLVYSGDFKDNKAHGIGTLTLKNSTLPNKSIEFKGLFIDGIPISGNLKTDFDSSGVPHLYYSGSVRLLNEFPFSLLMHGQGALLRTSSVPIARFFFNHSIGVNNSYYEGQFYYGACTGFGMYNFYSPEKQKNSMLQCGLVMADLSLQQFHSLPFHLDDTVINHKIFADSNNSGLRNLLPDLASARSAFYMIDGRRYTGMSYNNKPYGIGFMEDGEGFRDVGCWKNGEKISTMQLLSAVLPDSSVLKPYVVKNKTQLQYYEYNKRKNKYETLSETMGATVYHYGKMKDGKMHGWGWRMTEIDNAGLCTNASAGLFTASAEITDKQKDNLPDAENIFDIAYAQVYGTGRPDQTIVGITNAAKYRFYSGSTHNQVTKLLKPNPHNDIALGYRDVNTLGISEYRSRREYDILGTEAYLKNRIAESRIAEAKKKEAYDALFLNIKNPTKSDIQQCYNKFYMDRSANFLYKIISLNEGKGTFTASMYYNKAIAERQTITIAVADLLSSGNYRKVQNYVVCRSCGGTGTITSTYTYKADYEYTYGAKITTTYSKKSVCACGCGFVPEILGAKLDW